MPSFYQQFRLNNQNLRPKARRFPACGLLECYLAASSALRYRYPCVMRLEEPPGGDRIGCGEFRVVVAGADPQHISGPLVCTTFCTAASACGFTTRLLTGIEGSLLGVLRLVKVQLRPKPISMRVASVFPDCHPPGIKQPISSEIQHAEPDRLVRFYYDPGLSRIGESSA